MFIVTASNDNYAKFLGVMLTSLLENNMSTKNIHIFIIDGGISYANKSKLQGVIGRFNKQVTFLNLDKEIFEGFKMNPRLTHITKETYYRIIIPDLLSSNIKKALYLDCDLIVEGDLSELWNTDVGNYYLAAVDTTDIVPENRRKMINRELSIPENSHRFNAGVLLMNLEKWRQDQISKKLIDFITKNSEKLRLMDQDALIAVLHKKWLGLGPKWNYTTIHYQKKSLQEPVIIHFTGSKKPWNSEHPFKQLYFKYLKSSLWDQD